MKKQSIWVTLVCLVWLSLPLAGQSGRGTITGEVKDSTGAIVPGAEVVITNKGNGEERKSVTTDAGLYRLPYVEPGTYRITVSRQGFKAAIRDNVQVLLTQTVTADFTLELGEVSEHITVSEETPVLEASTAEIGTNADERDVHSWPVYSGDQRSLQDFIFNSMPGTSGNGFQGTINGGQTYSHEVMVDGISIGRMDINGGNMVEFQPVVDAVSEYKLQTGALSVQYGNTQTAITNFGLKTGTNAFHGSAFLFNQNKKLNANSWENNRFGDPRPTRVLNNWGATVGGPVIKDKTHFFFSYEGDRRSDFGTSGTDNLPVGAFKNGDFSSLFDPNFTNDPRSGTIVGKDALGRDVVFGQIYNPKSTRQSPDGTWIRDPFPGNIIPQDQFSAVTRNILKDDLPNPALNQLRRNNPRLATGFPIIKIINYSTKVDHVISPKQKMSGAFVYNHRESFRDGGNTYRIPGVPFPGPGIYGDKVENQPNWMIRLAHDWTVSPNKLNHVALGYNRFGEQNIASANLAGTDWAKTLGMQGVGSHSFPEVRFRGNNDTLSGGYRNYGHGPGGKYPDGSTIFQDDFTWIRGAHSWRMGGEIRRYYNNNQSLQGTGSYTYHNEQTGLPNSLALADALNSTGFAYASFLLGQAQSADLDVPLTTTGNRSQTLAFYFQDDWKVTPKLTLNLGVRWDIPTPIHEVAARMAGLDPKLPNPGADGFPGAFVVLGGGPGRNGKKNFADTYYREFGPRIGFAYALNQKTVIRGGYGINYAPPLLDGYNYYYTIGFDGSNPIYRTTTPFTGSPAYSWDTPYPPFTESLPNTFPTFLNGQGIPYYSPELQKLPYVQNWNLGVQYELPWKTRLEANYIGNKGTRLNEGQYIYSLNQADPKYLSLGDTLLDDINNHPEIPKPYPSFEGTVGRALRPFPQYESVSTHRTNNGYSTYHALQVTVTKRSNHGLSFIGAYTFSKSLATTDTAGPAASYGYNVAAQDFYNRKADYSPTQFHAPHDLKLSWIYDLPFGQKGRWLKSGVGRYALGGWTMSTIHHYRSGSTVALSSGNYEYQALFNPGLRADILLPRDQWLIASKPGNPDPDLGTPYLNPAAFAPPPLTPNNVPLRFGNSPRYLSQLRNFSELSEDFSLIKRTDLGFREGVNFELRIDVLNFFNRIGICGPSTNVNDPTSFGRVFGKCGGPRRIQLGARITF